MACNQGEAGAAKILLEYHPSLLNAKDLEKRTPLHNACCSTVYSCINGGKKCQRCSDHGSLPHSKSCSPVACVKLLLEKGLDVNQVDGDLDTRKQKKSIYLFIEIK